MNYGYRFVITTDRNYDRTILLKIRNVYERLSKRDWFPVCNRITRSSSGGYGTGHKDGKPLSELLLLTKEFPDIIFIIYYFYNSNNDVSIYTLKGDIVLSTLNVSQNQNNVNQNNKKNSYDYCDNYDLNIFKLNHIYENNVSDIVCHEYTHI